MQVYNFIRSVIVTALGAWLIMFGWQCADVSCVGTIPGLFLIWFGHHPRVDAYLLDRFQKAKLQHLGQILFYQGRVTWNWAWVLGSIYVGYYLWTNGPSFHDLTASPLGSDLLRTWHLIALTASLGFTIVGRFTIYVIRSKGLADLAGEADRSIAFFNNYCSAKAMFSYGVKFLRITLWAIGQVLAMGLVLVGLVLVALSSRPNLISMLSALFGAFWGWRLESLTLGVMIASVTVMVWTYLAHRVRNWPNQAEFSICVSGLGPAVDFLLKVFEDGGAQVEVEQAVTVPRPEDDPPPRKRREPVLVRTSLIEDIPSDEGVSEGPAGHGQRQRALLLPSDGPSPTTLVGISNPI